MAMTLRLSEADARRLRVRAERDGCSQHELVVAAVHEMLDNDVDFAEILADMTARYSEAFAELAEL
ncbi:hypothetical protein [Pseudonocardia sp. ICBG601]|uniref:hypothetical protein n=1 Tax=Pseudonocardia sp. ICBG601 TaxID=2846759 RepID=UPI001CF656A9|nr:hypothetical protein [Pseudonocardia sp. ICBG601]